MSGLNRYSREFAGDENGLVGVKHEHHEGVKLRRATGRDLRRHSSTVARRRLASL